MNKKHPFFDSEFIQPCGHPSVGRVLVVVAGVAAVVVAGTVAVVISGVAAVVVATAAAVVVAGVVAVVVVATSVVVVATIGHCGGNVVPNPLGSSS